MSEGGQNRHFEQHTWSPWSPWSPCPFDEYIFFIINNMTMRPRGSNSKGDQEAHESLRNTILAIFGPAGQHPEFHKSERTKV